MIFNDPGKYDELCTEARTAAKAKGVVLIVFDGEFGNGFSVQAPSNILMYLPSVLESVAKQIRIDVERISNG